ncbi:MAG: hypothetical protein GX372_08085 [Ignavibacteria bacterium]|nr:hypothetical protein [Ignavibacteria bacterium]
MNVGAYCIRSAKFDGVVNNWKTTSPAIAGTPPQEENFKMCEGVANNYRAPFEITLQFTTN